MAYFPFMIEVKGHKAIVVGAGQQAKDKIRALTEFGADVTVVAPVISADVVKQQKEIKIERRVYRPGETKGYEIVVAATDNAAVNKQVAHDAARFGAICTVAGDPTRGGFVFPAIIKRDSYSVAVSTDGEDPSMAEKLKESIEAVLPDSISDELDFADDSIADIEASDSGDTVGRMRLADIGGLDPAQEEEKEETNSEKAERASREEGSIIKVASLDSRLSQVQADQVISALLEQGLRCQKVLFREADSNKPVKIDEDEEGRNILITEIDEALINGDVDIAVRRAGDIPVKLADPLEITACLPREDARDVLVTRKGTDKTDISEIFAATTAEKVQIEKYLRAGDVKILKGDLLDTIRGLKDGECDAVVIDAAAFAKLHLADDEELSYEYIEVEKSLPAAGQGIVAIECRKTGNAHDIALGLNDEDAMKVLSAERKYMDGIDAEHMDMVAAYAVLNSGMMLMKVMKYLSMRCVYFAGAKPESEGLLLASSLADKVSRAEE